jgi:sensor c-di-GMP phosphodiesterase-like protein
MWVTSQSGCAIALLVICVLLAVVKILNVRPSDSMECSQLQQRLRTSIDRGEFALFYQPRADARFEKISSPKALIRLLQNRAAAA